jgi:hypothetical protein
MIIKKLAAPLINDKILQQVEHCYIATAAISETAFDFVKGRLPAKCKIEMVTGLDVPTSPMVLRRIWRHYQDRITLNIYTKNFFHPNVYIFDLPYRKTVAFVGSGHFTLEGLKDNEEIFIKITDPKEIETLKSWFTGYYEFSEPLTENLIQEYELIYPSIKRREAASRDEKAQLISLATRGFNWDNLKLKNHYFSKEDYLTFANSKVLLNTPEIQAERIAVQKKLISLDAMLQKHLGKLKLYSSSDKDCFVSSLDLFHHEEHSIRAMWVSYGRSPSELERNGFNSLTEFITIQIVIKQLGVEVCLAGRQHCAKTDRECFRTKMLDLEYRNEFFKLLVGLGGDYSIEIATEKRNVEFFQNAEQLWEYTKADNWLYYDFMISKSYAPSGIALINENIEMAMITEVEKLVLLYRLMKDNTFEKK